MYWRTEALLAILFLFVSCHEQKKEIALPIPTINSSNPLVEVEALNTLLNSKNHVLVDFRAIKSYESGHIPNAIQIWRHHIENQDFNYGGMMPSKEQLESLLSQKGIKNSDTLIIYDDRGSCDAARLWWVLTHYGFNQSKILNGGLRSYKYVNETLSTESFQLPKSNFQFGKTSNKYHISMLELEEELKDGSGLTILDARSTEEFSGHRQKKGAAKAGHIPTSLSFDWAKAVDYDQTDKFLPISTLEELYQKIAPNKEEPLVVYCHSGVRSAHTTFVLTQLLGYTNVKNYDGSWTEWSHHDLPFEKDVETIIFE